MKGLIIADQHFGAVDGIRLIDEHESALFSYIDTLDRLDFIFILGDYFDHKMYLNDYNAYAAMRVMQRIIEYAEKLKSIVRIIYGTASHECGQYNMFNSLFDKTSVDIELIDHSCDEELLGLNFLYIPEEYIYNKKEYYKETLYSGKQYDYILGHGVIQEVMTNACRHSDKSTTRKKVPYFTTMELKNACKGEVYFGHYHVNTTIQDNIHYVGSFSSWVFGEKANKGFYIIYTDDYDRCFVINSFARRFDDIYYESDNQIFKDENLLLKELGRIDVLLKDGIYEMLKLHFNIPEDCDNSQMIVRILTDRYKNNDNVKIDITDMESKKKRIQEHRNVVDNSTEYDIVFDKNIPIDEKIKFFIKKEFNEDVELSDIRECINITYEN